MWRTSTLAREDTCSSWTNGRKDGVSWTPRLPPRGFSESRQEQPRNWLHPYRRVTEGECFVIPSENFVPNQNNQGHRHSRLSALLNAPALLFQLFIKKSVFVANVLPSLASPCLPVRYASLRASARLFIYTQSHFSDIRNADPRSQRFTLKRHRTGRRPRCRTGPLGYFRLPGRRRRIWARSQ